MRFRGGEFSTGTTGDFQPELTLAKISSNEKVIVLCHAER
jgi:hypothetical protein